MGQYWNIVCLDAGHATGCLGKAGMFFFSSFPSQTFYPNLLVPDTIPQDLPPLPPITKTGPGQPSHLEQLSKKVIEKIFMYLDNFDDMLCLAMSSSLFLEIGRLCVLELHKSTFAPWAGKRLICVGDYAQSHPPGFLAQEEEEKFNGENIYSFSENNNFTEPKFLPKLEANNYERAFKYCKSTGKQSMLDALTKHCHYLSYYTEEPRILRNLTKREYVCEKEVEKVAGNHKFDFCTVLLSRIFWSDNSVGDVQGDIDERGLWAGDRFDITTGDKVDETWVDVSNEATDEVCMLFSANDF